MINVFSGRNFVSDVIDITTTTTNNNWNEYTGILLDLQGRAEPIRKPASKNSLQLVSWKTFSFITFKKDHKTRQVVDHQDVVLLQVLVKKTIVWTGFNEGVAASNL